MKVSEVIAALQKLKPGVDLLVALPGGRYSPVTIVEPFSRVGEDKQVVEIGVVYPHPRDVAAPTPEAPTTGSEIRSTIDAVFDFLAGSPTTEKEED